jgi:hypothetical protein
VPIDQRPLVPLCIGLKRTRSDKIATKDSCGQNNGGGNGLPSSRWRHDWNGVVKRRTRPDGTPHPAAREADLDRTNRSIADRLVSVCPRMPAGDEAMSSPMSVQTGCRVSARTETSYASAILDCQRVEPGH